MGILISLKMVMVRISIDDDIIEQSEIIQQKQYDRWYKYSVIAACVCVVVALSLTATYKLIQNEEYRWSIKEIHGSSNTSEHLAIIPKWDEMSISQKFSEAQFNGNQYSSQIIEISKLNIKSNIGNALLQGQNVYTNTMYNSTATVHEISGVSPDCAVAMCFDGQDKYYVYANHLYQPDTLGQFLDDLNLKDNLSLGSVWYEFKNTTGECATVEFTGLDAKIIWKMLLDDRSAQAIKDYDTHAFINTMTISTNVSLLGYENISIGVTDDGYLTTNILSTGKAFKIGKNKIQQFKQYLIDNCDGYIKKIGGDRLISINSKYKDLLLHE